MKLERVEIKNFRSIKEATIEFNPSCRVLVGKNESGKSNILKALRLLDRNAPLGKDDKREPSSNEKHIKDSYVEFAFTPGEGDAQKWLNAASSEILYKGSLPNISSADGKTTILVEIFSLFVPVLYRVNIGDRKKPVHAFHFVGSKFTYAPQQGDEWFKPTEHCPSEIFKNHLLTEDTLIHRSKLDEINTYDEGDESPVAEDYGRYLFGDEGLFQKITVKDWQSRFQKIISNALQELLPNVLFWDYRESELLPEKVDISSFRSDPNSCIPLKNMFLLYGIEEDEIGDFVESDLIKGSRNRCRNALNKIALATTTYFKSVWRGKEAQNIEFSLEYSNEQLITNIKEENLYRLDQRSDGFKRFVYFLLTLFLQAETDRLRNTLLLFDEPSIGLHPSSERDLRDELIKISDGNYLVYSTHSICMIDPDRIDRHYIVKRDDENKEVTRIEHPEDSDLFDEEVLLNALGYSVFEAINEKVIIFEGWRDKKLFYVARNGASKTLKNKYENVGICHARGARNIKTVTSLIDLAKRKCLIVSDSDEPSKQEQTGHKKEQGYGDWRTYQDIDSTIEAITGEDFVKNNFIVKQVNTVLNRNNMRLAKFKESDLLGKKDKLGDIRGWLNINGVDSQKLKKMVDEIKKLIFDELEYKNIDIDEYAKLLKGIVGYFELSA